jgi:hypothetical protein
VALDADDADALLGRLEAHVPVHPALVRLADPPAQEAIVFGDTHGDWRATLAALRPFLETPNRYLLIGLGDYIDRAPPDCEQGSVGNALFLLALAAEHPERVYLVQGNHEAHRRIPVVPHDLPEEVDELWGPDESRYWRIMHLLERGPLALLTTNGAYLAHAGFPHPPPAAPFPEEFATIDDDRLAQIIWSEPTVAHSRRGATAPFDEKELSAFLTRCGAQLFLRGHDPELTGRPAFGGRCLTLHTSRRYLRFGGVVSARLPLDRPVHGAADVALDHLEGALLGHSAGPSR